MIENKYFIWSYEHDAWWRPDFCGYSKDINEAGYYSFKDVAAICKSANLNNEEINPNEVMIHIEFLKAK